MKPVLVLYATREGHTRHIADHIVATAIQKGFPAVSRYLTEINSDIDFKAFRGIVFAGSIHAGKYPRELVSVVKAKREVFSQLPTALITVCLTQAGIENPDTSAEQRASAENAVRLLNDDFIRQTEFHPTCIKTVAGALPYTRYNLFIRWLMKRMVAKRGGDTDTSRDFVYTDWVALDRFIAEFLNYCAKSDDPGFTQLAS